jgi:hypothetical protein
MSQEHAEFTSQSTQSSSVGSGLAIFWLASWLAPGLAVAATADSAILRKGRALIARRAFMKADVVMSVRAVVEKRATPKPKGYTDQAARQTSISTSACIANNVDWTFIYNSITLACPCRCSEILPLWSFQLPL